MEPIKHMKIMVQSVVTCVIYVGIIHTAWYYFREKYVPEHQRTDTPFIKLYKHLTGKNTEKEDDDRN